ncbi:MAG: aryl-sulfate sulfotransferase [Planctomycetota bacterium]
MTDLAGNVVHSWPGTTRPGLAVYLAPNGDLVRTRFIANGPGGGGGGGAIERLTWDGDLLWQFDYTSATYHSHHDIALMPNGNVLMIAWESIGAAGATALGHDPATLSTQFWSEEIIEIEPDGAGGASVVWEWHAIDHVVQDFDAALPDFGDPSAHPERIDINYPEAGPGFDGDWLHANGIDYEPDLDQIVLSLRTFSEIWVIDHSTTTAEAAGSIGGDAGRGGDLLYRWGNPAAYGRGTAADQQLFSQHDPQWIAPGLPGAGHLLVFNNGVGRPIGDASSAVELAPPLRADGTYELLPGAPYGPALPALELFHPVPTSFFSPTTSGTQRLANGNTLLVAGRTGEFIELDPSGQLVWALTHALGGPPRTFKARRVPGGVVGDATCVAALNSTGAPGALHAVGSLRASQNALTLWAQDLPPDQFGFFLNANETGLVVGPGGSAGNLCLGGAIGRHNRAGEIFGAGAGGVGSLELDLTDLPRPSTVVAAVAGETWHWQCWYRDTPGGSNFTNAIQVTLQ